MKKHLDSASEDGSLTAAIGSVCSGARYRQHLHETMAARAEPGGPCNVCCVLQERASLSTHSEPGQGEDDLCCDAAQHGVTSGHAPSPLLLLVEVTACQVCQTVNATRAVYSTDPLIYSFLWRVRALDSSNNFLLGLPERNIRTRTQLAGRENEDDDKNMNQH